MCDSTNGSDGEICGDITCQRERRRRQEQVFREWIAGHSLDRIAKRIGLPVRDVYQYLKQAQKERIVEQG